MIKKSPQQAGNSEKPTLTLEQLIAQLNVFLSYLSSQQAPIFIRQIESLLQNTHSMLAQKEQLLHEGIHFTEKKWFYDAGRSLVAAAAIDPLCPRVKAARISQLLGQARRDHSKKWYSAAKACYKEALSLAPTSSEIKLEYYRFKVVNARVCLLVSINDPTYQQPVFRKILRYNQRILAEIDPHDAKALIGVGKSLIEINSLTNQEKNSALQALQTARRLDPENIQPWVILKEYYQQTRDLLAERHACEAILARKKDYTHVRNRLNRIIQELDQRQQSNATTKRERSPSFDEEPTHSRELRW